MKEILKMDYSKDSDIFNLPHFILTIPSYWNPNLIEEDEYGIYGEDKY